MARSRCRRQALSVALVILAMAALTLVACSNESSTAPPPPPGLTVNQLVETTGWFPSVAADSAAFTQARFDSATAQEGSLACADYLGFQIRAMDRLTILEATAAVHWPGSILQFATLGNLVPAVVDAPRAGGELVLTLADGSTTTGELAVLSAANVDDWRADALAGLPVVAGAWELEAAEVRDLAQVPVAAGVDPAAFPAAVRDLLVAVDPDHARALVRLQRTHHTVAATYPGRAGGAFAEGVMGVDLMDQMAEGNPPVWLGEVQHGQLVLVLVEADAPFATVLDAAVNTFVAAATGGEPDAGRPTLDDLPDLAVVAHAVAADAAAIADAAQAGLSALTAALAAPVVDPAALPPISASPMALRNGGPLTLRIEDTFAFVACEPYQAVFDDVLWSLDAADARTEVRQGDLQSGGNGIFLYRGGSRAFEYDYVVGVPDLRGRGASSIPDRFGSLPILHHDLVGGRAAIELHELGLPGGMVYSRFGIDGTPFVGEAYTLFLVVGMPGIIRLTVEAEPSNLVISVNNDLGLLIHGEEGGPRDGLEIGYSRGLMVYRHGQYTLGFPHEAPESWHVYAFRFSYTGGMTAWLDGQQLGHIGWDFSLLSFVGAKLGARRLNTDAPDHAVLWLAEAVAYRGSGSDDEVLAETARLREKYGF